MTFSIKIYEAGGGFMLFEAFIDSLTSSKVLRDLDLHTRRKASEIQ